MTLKIDDHKTSAEQVNSFTHEDVVRLAHALWESRGGTEGNSEEDWYRAEELLRDGVALREEHSAAGA